MILNSTGVYSQSVTEDNIAITATTLGHLGDFVNISRVYLPGTECGGGSRCSVSKAQVCVCVCVLWRHCQGDDRCCETRLQPLSPLSMCFEYGLWCVDCCALQIAKLYTALDIVAGIVFALSFVVLRFFERREAAIVDRQSITVSDYSVAVKGLPPVRRRLCSLPSPRLSLPPSH
jgi:hypothetical protein